jgi:hypothetical protein
VTSKSILDPRPVAKSRQDQGNKLVDAQDIERSSSWNRNHACFCFLLYKKYENPGDSPPLGNSVQEGISNL